MTELEWTAPPPDPTALVREPRKCRRHDWYTHPGPTPCYGLDGEIYLPAGTVHCRSCFKPKDEARARTNRNNRKRGKGTSHDLAEYLGWQNVEGMLWPWDVQGREGRLQSKRDIEGMGPTRSIRLIGAIPYRAAELRGVFHVPPSKRLASGIVTLYLSEWVAMYGWTLPPEAALVNAGGIALIRLPLPAFRDRVVGEARDAA